MRSTCRPRSKVGRKVPGEQSVRTFRPAFPANKPRAAGRNGSRAFLRPKIAVGKIPARKPCSDCARSYGPNPRHAFPGELSGGEQQRVSIARALAKNPKLLLCDEPTGALDYNTGKAILKLLQDTCRKKGMTVILITHNSAIAPMADRVIKIKNGKVSKVTLNENPISVETIEW